MSMEARVKQFHEEALAGLNSKSVKGMNTFRKFIHRNQEYNFTAREKSRLFGVVQAYFSMFDRGVSKVDQEDAPSSLGLIEDALKVPIFDTKQKNTMLKWLEELQKKGGEKSGGSEKEKTVYYEEEEYEDEYFDEGNIDEQQNNEEPEEVTETEPPKSSSSGKKKGKK
eukprot:TRINITY_DN8_c1_g1_i5.p1 TRINITY_DN8_c1_g1~~TRINITY_DN8_c1_g1_i5.p1  ORF type:complete len:181 (-),score=56.72 TRINITY_DN8_c1_g1_i5:258-761(-)